MTDYQKSICYQIAENYGEQHQMLKAVEEMAELTQAILKRMSGEWSIRPYAEELADVSIMIEQLIYLNDQKHGTINIEHYVQEKLERQINRMESDNDV